MSTSDPRPSEEVPPVNGQTVPSFAPPGIGSGRPALGSVGALVAALLATLGSWVVGERFLGFYAPSHEAAAHPYLFSTLRNEKSVADSRNTAIAYGALGAFLGVGLGLAGGLARRSLPIGLASAAAGGLLGGAAGAGPSLALVPFYLRTVDPTRPSLVLPLVSHGGIWTAIGLASGLAFGMGVGAGAGSLSRIIRAALGGAVGAAVGTVAFELFQAVAFPLQQSEELIGPTPTLRLAAILCVTVFVAAGAVAGAMLIVRRTPGKAP